MKFFTKVIAIILIFCMVLAGCGQTKKSEVVNQESSSAVEKAEQSKEDSKGKEKKLNITFVTPVIAHPVWLIAKQGFEDAGEDMNFDGAWVGPSTIDTNAMISQIEIAIAEKVDGIITMGMNPEAMVPVMKQAEEAGIPVVVVNSDIPNAPRLAYLGTNPKNLGQTGAKAIVEAMDGTAINAAIMVSALDYKVGNDMADGYLSVLEEVDGFNLVIKDESKADMLTAVQKWENIFNTYPDINVAINISGEAGAACAKVADEMGIADDVLIMAIDDIRETVDGIENEVIYGTMTQNFYRKGYQASQWLCDYIRDGKSPEELINDSGTMLVTKDNVATYAKDMENPDSW